MKLIPEKIPMNLHFWEMAELRKWFIKGNIKLVRTYFVSPSVHHFLLLLPLILLWGCIMLRTYPFSKLQEFLKSCRHWATISNPQQLQYIYSFHSMLHSKRFTSFQQIMQEKVNISSLKIFHSNAVVTWKLIIKRWRKNHVAVCQLFLLYKCNKYWG